MRFFTRELFERLHSANEAIVNAAENEWERANERYERHLQDMEPHLPPHVQEFNSLLLHDAQVQTIARQDDRLILILRKDIPPRNLVILAFQLAGEPELEPFAKNPVDWSKTTDFQFDEFDVIRDGEITLYTESIVFGNGWVLHLHFRDVRATLAAPVYPLPGAGTSLNLCPPVAQPA